MTGLGIFREIPVLCERANLPEVSNEVRVTDGLGHGRYRMSSGPAQLVY